MHIDFKTTVWERLTPDESIEEELQKMVVEGKISSAEEAFGHFGDDTLLGYETLPETSEQMLIGDNDGEATIEIHERKGDMMPIWNNGDERYGVTHAIWLRDEVIVNTEEILDNIKADLEEYIEGTLSPSVLPTIIEEIEQQQMSRQARETWKRQ